MVSGARERPKCQADTRLVYTNKLMHVDAMPAMKSAMEPIGNLRDLIC